MKEILGGEGLKNALRRLCSTAKRTYSSLRYEVWELSDKDFDVICNIDDADWVGTWGWWIHSEGSNLGDPNAEYTINGHKLLAWDFNPGKPVRPDRSYCSLLDYMAEELGASTDKNVSAVTTDLAKHNGLTLGSLFQKCQPVQDHWMIWRGFNESY